MPLMTMVQAIQDGLRVALREDSRVVILGEDVGLNGGVFRVTEGLQAVSADYLEKVAHARSEIVGFLDRSTGELATSVDLAVNTVAEQFNSAGGQLLASLDHRGDEPHCREGVLELLRHRAPFALLDDGIAA